MAIYQKVMACSLLIFGLSSFSLAQTFSNGTPAVLERLGQPAVMDMTEKVDWPRVHQQAKAGDRDAQYRLAVCFQTGNGCRRNQGRAVEWYRKAAQAGHGLAANNLGILYAQGIGGLPQSHEQAIYWFNQSARTGEVKAKLNLYVHYAKGWGVLRDLQKAMSLLFEATHQQEPAAQVELGRRYLKGDGIEKDLAEGRAWLEKATVLGDDSAPYLLGLSYEEVDLPDRLEAEKWYRLASEKGNHLATARLGMLLIKGEGEIQKNEAEGLSYLQKAAIAGEPGAKKQLGLLYRDGLIVTQDLFQAVRLFREVALFGDEEALNWVLDIHQRGYPEEQFFKDLFHWNMMRAETGNTSAKFALILQYRDGYGVDQNPQEAFSWLQELAVEGSPKAQYWLGLVYEEGQWIKQDLKQAFFWYHQAAKANVRPAWYKVGHAYAYGIGVEKDLAQAKHWLKLAASDQVVEAKQLLKHLDNRG